MERLFLECAIRAALLVAGAGIVLQAMRVKSAAARHGVWAGVVVLMLALPMWTAWGPKAALRVLPAVPERAASISAGAMDAGADSAAVPQEDGFNLEVATTAARPAAWNWRMTLLGVYLAGLCALLLRLAIGTVRAHGLVRRAVLRDGRLTSASCAAPVTVGWLRPRVILPEEWKEWPQEKLGAVLAHEGEHARRRDPLVQLLALVNRAVFWFHPAAWWLESRLAGLAEQACDDAVLARGHDPQDYSEYLMDMARSVTQSGGRVNLAGMAMPGSRLPERIRRILEGGPAARISRGRMACVGFACLLTGTVFAAGRLDHARGEDLMRSPEQAASGVPQLAADGPRFESVSIKYHTGDNNTRIFYIGSQPRVLKATNETLRGLVTWAYGLIPAQGRMIYGTPVGAAAIMGRGRPDWLIPGAPEWMDSLHFDIEASMEGETQGEEVRLMLQSLLAGRFRMAAHYETDVVPVYALELAEAGKTGRQLRRHVSDGSCWDPAAEQPPPSVTGQPTLPYCGGFRIAGPNGSVPENRRNITMAGMATFLTGLLDRPVLDRTGLLDGRFDFDLVRDRTAESDLSPLFIALREQLGLRLVPTNGPVTTLVIDHVERPAEGSFAAQ
jgi:uncharacterized protein (TIGR03435 family)